MTRRSTDYTGPVYNMSQHMQNLVTALGHLCQTNQTEHIQILTNEILKLGREHLADRTIVEVEDFPEIPRHTKPKGML